jgi:hypothetical protein
LKRIPRPSAVAEQLVWADSRGVLKSKGGASAMFRRRLFLSHCACPDNHTTTITTATSTQSFWAIRISRPLDSLGTTEGPLDARWSRDGSPSAADLQASLFRRLFCSQHHANLRRRPSYFPRSSPHAIAADHRRFFDETRHLLSLGQWKERASRSTDPVSGLLHYPLQRRRSRLAQKHT